MASENLSSTNRERRCHWLSYLRTRPAGVTAQFITGTFQRAKKARRSSFWSPAGEQAELNSSRRSRIRVWQGTLP